MASNRNSSRQMWLTALIVAVALVGLVAGALTRDVIAASNGGRVVQRPTQIPGATGTTTLADTPSATVPPTIAPALVHFSIKVTASPNSGHPGDTVTFIATVTADDSGQPVAGLTCHLRAPTDGEPAFLTTWPAPTATNINGIASWTVTVPPMQSGRYVVEVFGQTPSWSYVARTGYTVTA